MVTEVDEATTSRQTDIIDSSISDLKVGLIGLGTVGSWAAPLILKLGVRELEIWDDDTIEWANVDCQMYGGDHVDRSKAEVVNELLLTMGHIHPHTQLVINKGRFELPKRGVIPPDVLVSAVDNWAGREAILSWAARGSKAYIEARMMARWSVVHAIEPSKANVKWMRGTFGVDGEGPAVQCGNRGTAFLGAKVGAEIAALIVNVVNGEPLPRETAYDLGLHMNVGGEE